MNEQEVPDENQPRTGSPVGRNEGGGRNYRTDRQFVLPSSFEGIALTDLLGSRLPVVLFRLVRDGDTVTAQATAAPRSGSAAEALEELRVFLEDRFHSGRQELLEPREWERLLGTEPAPVLERLLLLGRLAVGSNTHLMLADGTGGHVSFTPHDRGLGRYAGKFAALPDGMPFSLGLLVRDGRGRRKENSHPFDRLPEAIKFLGIRQALAAEAVQRTACDDNTFRSQLRDALASLGLVVDKPTEDHVVRFRETLKRHDLGHLFPNARARQKEYDNRPSRKEEG
jgi:hypothetical protein